MGIQPSGCAGNLNDSMTRMPHIVKALTTLCAFGLLTSPATAVTTLRLCSVVWPPYTTFTEGRVGGTHTDRVRATLNQLGYAVAIDVIAWERCLQGTREGYYQGIFSVSHSRERASFLLYPSVPLETLYYRAVVRKGTPHGWDEARRYARLPQPVAAPNGWSVTRHLKLQQGLAVDDGSVSNEQDIRKLLASRAGSAVVEVTVARLLLDRLDTQKQLEVLPVDIVPPRDYFFALSRVAFSPEEASALIDALDQINVKEKSRP